MRKRKRREGGRSSWARGVEAGEGKKERERSVEIE